VTQSRIIPVDLGNRSYNIVIGDDVLASAGEHIKPHLNSNRVAVVTDKTVHDLHWKTLETSLNAAGLDAHLIVKPVGEAEKSFESLESLLNQLLEQGFDRNDAVIAFGGGVIGDLTGFAASVFKRGCRFIQIPTTLLAQVDSSVGGKTAINSRYGKNLIGAFYQPRLVLTDTSVLKTLPERELKAGYAEVLKYGLLGDYAFVEWLETNGTKVLSGDPDALAYAIAKSCETKARIVSQDEHERGTRALLNLGHTFGHALEAEAGYDGDLLHGEAVSAGMLMAFEFSQQSGLCAAQDMERVARHISEMKLTSPVDCRTLLTNSDALLFHMDQDKKNEAGQLTLILVRAIGDAFIQTGADRVAVKSYLENLRTRAHA